MTTYLIRRSIQMAFVLVISSIAIYAMLNLAPGGPLSGLNLGADQKERLSQDEIQKMKEQLGLHLPVQMRYVAWLTGDDWLGALNQEWAGDSKGILRGDFGESFKKKRPVAQMLRDVLPRTLLLMTTSTLLAMAVAIPVGIFSAVRQYSKLDYIFTFFTFMGIAIPAFWFGLMLIVFLGDRVSDWGLPKFPTGGIASRRPPREGTILHVLGAEPGSWLDRAVHLVLPTIVLSLVHMAGWGRFVRSSMLEVLRQDYVRTARAKGLNERVVIAKHALRNALIPLVTIVTFEVPNIFGGAILTETVFAYPGMGRLYIDALNGYDYPVVQAYLIILAVLVVFATLTSDILYTVVDPRIRY